MSVSGRKRVLKAAYPPSERFLALQDVYSRPGPTAEEDPKRILCAFRDSAIGNGFTRGSERKAQNNRKRNPTEQKIRHRTHGDYESKRSVSLLRLSRKTQFLTTNLQRNRNNLTQLIAATKSLNNTTRELMQKPLRVSLVFPKLYSHNKFKNRKKERDLKGKFN